MECESCGERPAEITFTVIEDDELKTLKLCAICASEKGLSQQDAKVPLVGFLAQLGKGGGPPSATVPEEPCPFCGTSALDFRKTGRVGCAQCYAHFEGPLRNLLRRLHGASQHAGKLYLSEKSEIGERLGQLASMRRRLQRAIETEDFETAAELRDRIHELETAE